MQLDPNFALAWARLSRADAPLYFVARDMTPLGAMRPKELWRMRRNCSRTRPKPSSPWVIINILVLRDYGLPKPRSGSLAKCCQAAARSHAALAIVARREGHWDESVAYWEQALALDPRNVQLLNEAAVTYAQLRQFPTALKLYDRALDIVPNDPGLMALKASIYQAEGNLREAAELLSQINAQTPSTIALVIKMTQLRLERNYAEAIQFLQARLAQFHSASDIDKSHYSGHPGCHAAPCRGYRWRKSCG